MSLLSQVHLNNECQMAHTRSNQLEIMAIFSRIKESLSILCEENIRLSCPIHKIQIAELPDSYEELALLANAFGELKSMFYEQVRIRVSLENYQIEEEQYKPIENSIDTLIEKLNSMERNIHLLGEYNAKMRKASLLTKIESITDADLGNLSNYQLIEFNDKIESAKSRIDQKILTLMLRSTK